MMLRKILIAGTVVAALFVVQNPVHAQPGCFAQGDMMIDAGVGIWPFIPQAHFDIAVHDLVSVGAGTGILIPWIDIPILARGAFHPFNLPPIQGKIDIRHQLDPYVGLIAGISISPGENKPVRPVFGELIGCRFYISDAFGFYAEHEWGGPGEELGRLAGGVALRF